MDYDKLVFVGRIRPPTKAHLQVIREGLDRAKQVIVIVGSCFAPRSVRNVWLFHEVETMLRLALTPEENARVIVKAIPDYTYADALWVRRVQEVVAEVTAPADKIGLIGHAKDNTSFYLALFPRWGSVNVPNYRGINATEARDIYFTTDTGWREKLRDLLPETVVNYLDAWRSTPYFYDMMREVAFVRDYRKEWGTGPFLTADSVVVQSGHVLLIQRGDRPGKGLWAMPGGFVHQDETMLTAAVRELHEETNLDMPKGAIEGSLKAAMLFDDPNRDPRARIVTQAHLFDLDHEVQRRAKRTKGSQPLNLTKVKGGDDAAHAEWIPLANIKREMMFADHYHIVTKMVAKL